MRTAVWASSGVIHRARSTAERSLLPAAQADPLEQTMPRRSSSTTIDSPLVPAKVKEALPANRECAEPVSRALGTAERMSRMKPSRASARPTAFSARDRSASSRATGGLHRIGVHDRADRVGDPRDPRDGLHSADLVVGVHHADERRVGTECIGEFGKTDRPVAVYPETSDLEPVKPFEIVTALEHSRMLDDGRHDVAPAGMGERDARDREIRPLRATGGEHDLGGPIPEDRRNPCAGIR